MEELEIYIENSYAMHAAKIYFIIRRNGKSSLGRITKDGDIEFKEFDPEEATEDKPTMIMDIHYFEIFGRAMLKALKEKHIEPEEESFIKGKLKATEYHLSDLRTLLKLENKKV